MFACRVAGGVFRRRSLPPNCKITILVPSGTALDSRASMPPVVSPDTPAFESRMQAYPEIQRAACWLDCRAPFRMAPKSLSYSLGATIFGETLPQPHDKRTLPVFSRNFANGESGWFKPIASCGPPRQL